MILTTVILVAGFGSWALAGNASSGPTDDDPEQHLNHVLASYVRHQRPRFSGTDYNKPVIVRVNMFVASFSSVSMVDMDYTVDFMLRQRWRDERLNFSLPGSPTLSLGYMKDRLWIPDLFFRNAKAGQLHTITTPNYLIWLRPGGELLFSQKLTIKFSCPMRLWNFPMDTQECRMEMGSYGYSTQDLDLVWWGSNATDHVTLSSGLYLNEFAVPRLSTGSCTKKFAKTGRFACLYVQFLLERKFAFYLTYTYLPSALILVISWLSFLLDSKAVPARISIGLLSVLALMTQSAATLQQLPRVSYIKAIDVWLFACLAFVVLSLLEFAVVNSLERGARTAELKQQQKQAKESRDDAGGENVPLKARDEEEAVGQKEGAGSNNFNSKPAEKNPEVKTTRAVSLARRVDQLCVIFFPILFGIFNAFYWSHFSPQLNET